MSKKQRAREPFPVPPTPVSARVAREAILKRLPANGLQLESNAWTIIHDITWKENLFPDCLALDRELSALMQRTRSLRLFDRFESAIWARERRYALAGYLVGFVAGNKTVDTMAGKVNYVRQRVAMIESLLKYRGYRGATFGAQMDAEADKGAASELADIGNILQSLTGVGDGNTGGRTMSATDTMRTTSKTRTQSLQLLRFPRHVPSATPADLRRTVVTCLHLEAHGAFNVVADLIDELTHKFGFRNAKPGGK